MFEARTERIQSKRQPSEGDAPAPPKTGQVSSEEFLENASHGGGIGYERR